MSFHFVGKTHSRKLMLANVFPLVGTHGLPLETVLTLFELHKWTIDWCDFILAMAKDGASNRTIRARIVSAVTEVCGRDRGKIMDDNLDFLGIT